MPTARRGWPPLSGDYHVVRHGAPVAVCTLNTESLAKKLAADAPRGLAIAGKLHTENLGNERVVRNVLANPHVRFLVLCGADTKQAMQFVSSLPGRAGDDRTAPANRPSERRRVRPENEVGWPALPAVAPSHRRVGEPHDGEDSHSVREWEASAEAEGKPTRRGYGVTATVTVGPCANA